jgi:uncharacterized protein (DUF2147 family)
MTIMKVLFLISFLLLNIIKNDKPSEKINSTYADKIIGTWLSADKDLKVEIFNRNGHYFGKVVWFACLPTTPNMDDFKDTENPDPKLRTRKWLGMEVVENLTYNKESSWENGTIYDPNSGRKYSSVVRLKDNNTLVVRGYWGIELFGKSLDFKRVI